MSKVLSKRFFKKIQSPVIAVPVKKLPGSIQSPISQKPNSTRKFPSISLAIPESLVVRDIFLSRIFLFNFACGFILMAIGIVTNDIRQNIFVLSEKQQEKHILVSQIAYWKNIVGLHNGYRDAWYQLAMLEYRMGSGQAAYDHAKEALRIDPEFADAKQLMEELE